MIYNIQILRAFAALAVVHFHTIGTARSYGFEANLLSGLEGWGGSGVDIFFVISGFIMVYVQRLKSRTPAGFLADRVIRIVPAYWILTLAFFCMSVALPGASRTHVPTVEWTAYSLFFLSQAGLGQMPVLFVGWSLEYEMLFYLILGASLFARNLIVSIVLTSVAVIVFSFVFAQGALLLEFVFGMALGVLHQFDRRRPAFGLAALIVGALLLLSPIVYPIDMGRTLHAGLPGALVLYGCLNVRQIRGALGKLLGDASYSIYLIQVFTIPVFYKLLSGARLSTSASDVYIVACIVLTAAAGIAFYWLVEKRLMALIKGYRSPSYAPNGKRVA